MLFGKMPFKAQNRYIFQKFWGHGSFGPPLATPVARPAGINDCCQRARLKIFKNLWLA